MNVACRSFRIQQEGRPPACGYLQSKVRGTVYLEREGL